MFFFVSSLQCGRAGCFQERGPASVPVTAVCVCPAQRLLAGQHCLDWWNCDVPNKLFVRNNLNPKVPYLAPKKSQLPRFCKGSCDFAK
jgi:hypothetical protein